MSDAFHRLQLCIDWCLFAKSPKWSSFVTGKDWRKYRVFLFKNETKYINNIFLFTWLNITI